MSERTHQPQIRPRRCRLEKSGFDRFVAALRIYKSDVLPRRFKTIGDSIRISTIFQKRELINISDSGLLVTINGKITVKKIIIFKKTY